MTPADERHEFVTSADGTPIAVFRSGPPGGRPIVLVHGTAGDHTTFRVVGPMLARRYALAAVDRRGRGASGDREPWSIEREFEDIAAVADALAEESGGPVPVVGHSLGGRVALGAALVGGSVGAIVSYEGAPPAPGAPPYHAPDLPARLAALNDDGRHAELLDAFLREVVGMSPADLDAYHADPVWPARVAAAPTIVREIVGAGTPAAGLDVLSRVDVPVLQLLGSESLPSFAAAVRTLDARLANGRVEVIEGARHAAHHTHPDRFVALVTAFIDAP